MLGFVQSWFTPASSPIGVDFGSDCLRMAQVELIGNEHHLTAAGSADVPPHVRNDPAARFSFFADAARDLIGDGEFRGRRVILNLPASLMHIQHLRLPKMEEDALKKALTWEAQGKLPFDPSHAVLRHLIAGEVYHDQEPKFEVILMAARRDLVDQYLAAAEKARLQVVGMHVEPKAILDCYSHIFRRASDVDASTCYVDIGCNATRAIIARSGKIRFARVIPIGGEHFSRAVASAMRIPLDEARQLRLKLAGSMTDETTVSKSSAAQESPPASQVVAADERMREGTQFALLDAALSAAEKQNAPATAPSKVVTIAEPAPAAPAANRQVDEACREPLARLIEELSLCRRYYESTFHDQPVQRLIFVGGEANQRGLCQQIAREMGLAAQIGDPLCRMSKFIRPGMESAVDRSVAQPSWSVAIGLSIGQPVVQTVKAK